MPSALAYGRHHELSATEKGRELFSRESDAEVVDNGLSNVVQGQGDANGNNTSGKESPSYRLTSRLW